MNTLRYLTDPQLAPLFLPGLITGLAMAIMCSCLSVLVVLKRMSFIGQGISHAAFGGMGIAAILGLTGLGASAVGQFGIVVAFCLASALMIAWLSSRGSTSSDTAIGIVLVGSMCLGAILLHLAIQRRGSGGPGWESILFGSIYGLSITEAWVAVIVAILVLAAIWWFRRPLIFWAFDEPSSAAFGIPGRAMRNLLLVLLCLAIVTAMKVSGVVLATAMLVLPAASALCLSDRLWRALVLAELIGLAGVLAGTILSMELEWPPGPSVVAALTILFALCRLSEALKPRGGPSPTPSPG